MSELAAKLARRRALNGEADPVNDVTSATSHVPVRSAQALQAEKDREAAAAAQLAAEQAEKDREAAAAAQLAAEKPKDELEELEDFFDKLDGDPYMESLDIDSTPDADVFRRGRAAGHSTSSADGLPGGKQGADLFDDLNDEDMLASASEDFSSFFSSDQNSRNGISMRELSRENNSLCAKVKSLTSKLRDREERIIELKKSIQGTGAAGNTSDGEIAAGAKSPGMYDNDEDFEFMPKPNKSGPSPSAKRASRRRSGNDINELFGEGDGDELFASGEVQKAGGSGISDGGLGASELAKMNEQLLGKTEFLSGEIKKRDVIIDKLQKEGGITNRRSSSTWHDRAVLKDIMSNLDTIGFDQTKVEHLIDEMGDAPAPSVPSLQSNLSDEDRSNLDSLLFSSSHKTASLDQYASLLSATSDHAGFMFQEQGRGKERSDSDVGLSQQQLASHGLFGDDSGSADGGEKTSVGGRNQTALFKEDAHRPPQKERPTKGDEDKNIFYYQEFINKLMQPESKDIVNAIRNFLQSVLGPNGDCTPSTDGGKLDYEFHGTARLPARACDFIEAIIEHMMSDSFWGGETDERYVSARDCLEKFIMTKLGVYAFKSVEDPVEDALLLRRMKLLSFLETDALDIKPELCNDLVWSLARDELRKINSYQLPADKIACVTRCASVIFRSLNLARAKTEENTDDSAPGADDFLPLLIWVVMGCHVPQLYSNCEYIQSFHNPIHLRGKAGYCFINMRSAMEFVNNLDVEDVSMNSEEFKRKMKESEEKLASEG